MWKKCIIHEYIQKVYYTWIYSKSVLHMNIFKKCIIKENIQNVYYTWINSKFVLYMNKFKKCIIHENIQKVYYTWIYSKSVLYMTIFKMCIIHENIQTWNLVEGDPKAPFQKLIHWGVGKGATPFSGILHFSIDLYFIMLNVKQSGIKYHFLSLWYDSTWIEPRSPGPVANALTIIPMGRSGVCTLNCNRINHLLRYKMN